MKPSAQLKRMIEQSPLTAYRIAKLAGLSESVIGLFLAGKRSLTLETVDALADVLGLSLTGDGRDKKLAADAPKRGRPPVKHRNEAAR